MTEYVYPYQLYQFPPNLQKLINKDRVGLDAREGF